MKKPPYRVFEGLRIAICLTFISGYLNAFSFVALEGRFAGVQSGNVLLLAYHAALGQWSKAASFLIPIACFVVGQFFTYLAKEWFVKNTLPWHLGSSLMMLGVVLLTLAGQFIFPSLFTMASLAFLASIQVETFRRVRGAPYANVMMTGNVKNAAYLWFKGKVEKDRELQQRGTAIFLTILGFMFGVVLATLVTVKKAEWALAGLIFPIVYVNYQLWKEKRNESGR